MTPEERYRFDIQGFLVRRGVLSAGDVEALNVAVDLIDAPEPGDDIMSQRFVGHLVAARRFRDLLDHEGIFDIVLELCGSSARLDHAYGIIMRPGTNGLGLHGGGKPFDPAQYYTVDGGAIRTGLVAVQWALVDHNPGRGGFLCVPGSHKANFPTARRDRRGHGRRGADEGRRCRDLHRGPDPRHVDVARPATAADVALQVLPRQLGVVARGVAGRAVQLMHVATAPAAATTVGRQPPTVAMITHLFVYGTLRPGQQRWPFLEPFVMDEGHDESVVGTLYDTGHGYPAAKFDRPGTILGRVYPLNLDRLDEGLKLLDEVEGAVIDLFRRVADHHVDRNRSMGVRVLRRAAAVPPRSIRRAVWSQPDVSV